MSGRETALNVLIACRQKGAWSNSALKEYCARDGLDRREAALAARLCYGVLQNRYKLDFYLKQLLTGRLKNLHPVLRDILHLGLYQIYEMDKIPASAAVNEAVTLAKKYCKKLRNAAPLTNGVLRNAVRTKGTLKEPQTLQDIYSHPQKLIDCLAPNVGVHLETMLAANNSPVPTVVQVNTLKTSQEALLEVLLEAGISAENHPWLWNCLVLSGTGDLEKLDAFQKGLFYVQDAAARLSILWADIQDGARVLDCCAAPGGKSFTAALDGAGEVISCDIHPHKLKLIEKGAQRLGLSCITTRLQDASVPVPEWVGKMDTVIADVPCSGYGIIRKKPDIRYKDPEDMKALPALQLAILENVAAYVAPGGVLLYSTCTLLREENEGVVEQFLKTHPEFFPQAMIRPNGFPPNDGMMTLIPGVYDTDGFFICKLRRTV